VVHERVDDVLLVGFVATREATAVDLDDGRPLRDGVAAGLIQIELQRDRLIVQVGRAPVLQVARATIAPSARRARTETTARVECFMRRP
jgi:hypothetical protein